MTGSVLVVVPTYDELDSLPGVLDRLRAAVPDASVLVVDDASPDGTGRYAERRARADAHVHVLHRAGKQGLGAAYLAGFAWAAERGFDVVVEMDADGSHAPEELPRLLARLAGADVVLGSRYVAGGRVRNWPWRRHLLSRAANVWVRAAVGTRLRDTTGGFRAYRRPVLDHVCRRPVASAGYCFQIDLALRAEQAGYRVAEAPITFVERAHGTSKMDDAIVREALARTVAWGWAARRRQLRAVLRRPPRPAPARVPLEPVETPS